MVSCGVATCKNYDCKQSRDVGIKFHRFPTDKSIQKQWLTKCCRKDKVNVRCARLCSTHFKDDDYERDLMAELLDLQRPRLLKKDAIPSLLLPNSKVPTPAASKRKLRMEDKNAKKQKLEILEEALSIPDPQPPITVESDHTDEQEVQQTEKDLPDPLTQCKQEIASLQTKIRTIQGKNLFLRNRNRKLKARIAKENKIQVKKKMQSSKEIFSASQTRLLSGKKKVKWTSSDISKALGIAVLSKRAYETIRKEWKIPLPAPSTLRRWASRFKCQPGILEEVLTIMEAESINLDPLSKLCILKFDEMSLTSTISWDKSSDTILKPYSKVQVVMASGICAKWNQPIFYNFDTNITPSILNEIILKVENAGYKVTSIVHDFDTQNQGLWTALKVTQEKPYFIHPVDHSRKIWTFADAPHMLKLIRNHILDQGFMLKDGTLIDRFVLMKLVEFDSHELKLCPKLNPNLLTVKGAERMKVSPAAKLLSSHTAAISKVVFPETKEISEFFQLMDDWFDIFNSHLAQDFDKPIRGAYGHALLKQKNKLSAVEELISGMRCRLWSKKKNDFVVRTNLIPCQTGILVSIKALQGLFEDLLSCYNVTYIRTRKLNQDSLESHFSQIRALGRTDDAPTQVSFRDREKLLLLGAKCKPPTSGNVETKEMDLNYISRKLLEQAAENDIVPIADNISRTEEDDLNNFDTEDEPVEISTVAENDNCSRASLYYLAGYIAFRIKKSGGEKLGTITRRQPPAISEPGALTSLTDVWIHTLSRGGLMVPNDDLFQQILQCESSFNSRYPSDEVMEKKGISAEVCKSILKDYPKINLEVLNRFVHVRLRIRIKYLNHRRKVDLISRRNVKKAKQFSKNSI